MIVSRNEIESLALKAARGAGMSWGLAEESSIAAGWLAEHALPWADTLLGVLAQADATSPPRIVGQALLPSRPGTRLCPIMTGGFLSDLGLPASAMEIHDLLAPLWLAPFAASWAGPDQVVRLGWGDASLLVGRSAVAGADAVPAAIHATPFAKRVTMVLEPMSGAPTYRRRIAPSGYAVCEEIWCALQEFERKTYVPASAQSRIAGAGAGLLDND
jgi:hypothetical protein